MKKLPFWIFVLAGFFTLMGCGGERTPRAKAGPEVPVKLYPSGELDYLPDRVVLSFSREFPSVSGLRISAEEIGKYIKLDPPIPISGRWTSPSTFQVKFLAPLKPASRYTIKILRVPIGEKRLKAIPDTFHLKTPGLKLLSFTAVSSSSSGVVLRLNFNGEVRAKEVLNYMSLKAEDGRDVPILDVRGNGEEVYLRVKAKPPCKLLLRLREGLPSSLGPLPREYAASLSVAVPRDFMMVEKVKFRESEKGFSLVIKFSSPAGEVDLTGIDPTPFLSTDPRVSIKAFASGNGVFVSSQEFLPGRKFTLTVKAGLMDRNGFVLKKDYTTDLVVPSRSAKLRFVYRGKYLGRNQGLRLPIRAEGLRDLYITVFYVPPTNALFWHSVYQGEDWGLESFGEKVVEKSHIKPREGINWLDLSKLIGETKPGVYFLVARGVSRGGHTVKDSMEVVVSDISLVVKVARHRVHIWAMRAADLEPLSGVKVEVRDRKNFRLGTCSTGSYGYCELEREEGKKPFFVFARLDGDWTYLNIPASSISLTNFWVSGKAGKGDFSGYLYFERNLYRPGERVNFVLLLRNSGTYRGASMPVSVRITDPRGKEAYKLSAKTDKTGLASFSFLTVKSSPTGVYRVEAKVGDRVVALAGFHLEEFVPERMKVEVRPGKSVKDPVVVSASYLFGAPASGQRFSARIFMEETGFACPSHPDYHLGPSREIQPYHELKKTIKGVLDEEGKGSFYLPVFSPPPSLPIRVRLAVSVSEGGSGRVSRAFVSRVYHLRPYYIGLSSDTRRVVEGHPVGVSGLILTPDCKPFEGEVNLLYTVYRLSRVYSYSYQEEEYGWSSRIVREPLFSGRIRAKGGRFSLEFTPSDSYYDYLVEVVDEKTGEVAHLVLPGWGWYFTGATPPSPQTLNIRLSREEGDEGQQVEAQVKLPFEGKIIWTLELDGIYKYEVKEARGEVATWKFALPRGVPNVYVSALLVRSSGNYLVSRAFGVKRVLVRPSRVKMNLDVEAPERVKPGETLKIKIKGKGDFEATVAVVDEGILQIANFRTPDPLKGILRPLALGVRTSETFGWRIRKFLLEGGDVLEGLEGEGGAVLAGIKGGEEIKPRFVKIVSFWSGVLKSRRGQILYSVKLPRFTGKLRIMVAGVSEKAMGSAQAWVEVRDDVVVQPTLPRFLAWGDSFQFPVTLINTTRKEKKVFFSLESSGLNLEEFPGEVRLGPGRTRVVWVKASAEQGISRASLKIKVRWDGGSFADEYSIPVKPNLPRLQESYFKTLSLPAELDLWPMFDGWVSRQHITTVLVSPYPGLSALSHLDYILSYPYGCLEQVSSATLALLSSRDFLGVMAPELSSNEVSNRVNHGILKILTMQTFEGGFSFWPGGDVQNWVSAYATFVLQEASQAGFYVPESSLKGAYYFLKKSPKNGLSYFVLARGGMVQRDPELKGRILEASHRFKDRLNLLWVAAGLKEAGLVEEARSLLHRVLSMPLPRRRTFSGDFRSPLKVRAVSLLVQEWIEPEAGLEEDLMALMSALSGRSYFYTTQEIAWALLAASHYARLHPPARDLEAVLLLDGKEVKPEKEKFLQRFLVTGGPSRSMVKIKLKGRGSAFVVVKMEGFRKEVRAFQAEARHLNISRRFLSMDGRPLKRARVGDLLLMEVTVSGDAPYDNAAVELPLPAGLEAEIVRGEEETLPVKNSFSPDYTDIRDDRVVLFGRVSPSPRRFYIMLRAVTPGEFFLPPARVSLMYGPGYFARTYSDAFSVEKR